MKKRVLITGATGFIGGHILHEAIRSDLEVWVAVRPQSNVKKLQGLPIHIIEVDYSSVESLSNLVREHTREHAPAWDYVIHNAGLTKTTKPKQFMQVNALLTKRLLDALCSVPLRPEHFLLMSSMSTYRPPQTKDEIITELTPQQPNTAYGRSKLEAELYVQASGLPYTILQPTGVYGPGDEDYMMAIKSIGRGFNAMAGMTPQYLTFVYGPDVARAALFLIQTPKAIGHKYILSDGEECTDFEFGKLVQKIYGRNFVFHLRVPLWVVRTICELSSLIGSLTGRVTTLNRDKYHILAQRNWRCSPNAIKELGYKTDYKLKTGLIETIVRLKTQYAPS